MAGIFLQNNAVTQAETLVTYTSNVIDLEENTNI